MMRGDLITIAVQGDFGKPRPAVVIQSDLFEAHSSVTVLPITSSLVDAPLLRITVQPTPQNGLQKTSQIMIDKTLTVRKDKVGLTGGRLERETMLEIERCLAVFLGIAK
jgi:mRNA interferase MazF